MKIVAALNFIAIVGSFIGEYFGYLENKCTNLFLSGTLYLKKSFISSDVELWYHIRSSHHTQIIVTTGIYALYLHLWCFNHSMQLLFLLFLVPIYTESDVSLSVSVPNAPLSRDESDYTIVYDKQNGYKKIALSDVQADEVVPFFDIAQDVRFELFTPKNPTVPQILTLNNYTTVKQSNFNWWHQTRILVHGWYINLFLNFIQLF